MPRHRRDTFLFTVVVGALVCVGALTMALVLALGGESDTLVVGALLAALPVVPLLGCFMWLDRYEPEPRSLLAAGLAWGAFVATGGAIAVQLLGQAWVYTTETQSAAVVAPVVEEATKGAFLLLLLWWRRHELDGVLDGIVYAGMVGIGFAFTENILYLGAAAQEVDGVADPTGLTLTFVLRCLVSPFAHPFFTAATGIGVGLAVTSRSGAVRWSAPVGGYLTAVALHAVWNASTSGLFGGFWLVYLVVMAPLFVLGLVFAVFVRDTERRLLEAALRDAAARGLLPASDIPWLVDLRARRHGRTHAKMQGGTDGARRMRDYQQAAVELGFLHHRYLRGTPPPDYAERGRDHVRRLRAVRPSISFPGQVVPTR